MLYKGLTNCLLDQIKRLYSRKSCLLGLLKFKYYKRDRSILENYMSNKTAKYKTTQHNTRQHDKTDGNASTTRNNTSTTRDNTRQHKYSTRQH